jgi:DNA (cytosine-5)-methyltransferase 1
LTIATANDQTLFTDTSVRRLTPTECERLQGFPDGWTEGQSDTHRYKQMGNAVAVPVVEWLIEGLVSS